MIRPRVTIVVVTYNSADVLEDCLASIELHASDCATIVVDNAYGGLKPAEIKISPDDYHPNEIGHRHVARRLLERMKEQREELGLPAQIEAAAPIVP